MDFFSVKIQDSFGGNGRMCYLCVRNREMQRVLSSVGSEHLVYTQRVGGSTPSGPTNKGMRSARDASFLLGLFNPKMVPVAANEFLVIPDSSSFAKYGFVFNFFVLFLSSKK